MAESAPDAQLETPIEACSLCGGPLTRGAGAVEREMARRAGDTVFTGVRIGNLHDGAVMCWACAEAEVEAWQRERDRQRFQQAGGR